MSSILDHDLMGRADIAKLFGVTRSAPAQWIERYDDFPAPVDTINDDAVEVYARRDIEAWGRKTRRLDCESGRLYDDNGYDVTDNYKETA